MEYLGLEKPINQLEPLVSVCVTTYQHASFIRKCLDSILMQETDFPFEVIIGEDDSKDGTREICIEYAERYPDKIRLFLRDEKDKIYIGGHKTGRFNFAQNILSAKGKYVALCEGDDFWTSPSKLQTQYEHLEENPHLVLTGGRVELVFEKDDFARSGKFYGIDEYFEFTIEDIFISNKIPTLTAFFKNGLINDFPDLFLYKGSGDRGLYIQLLNYGDGSYLPNLFGCYRRHSGGMTKQTHASIEKRYYLFLQSIFNSYEWNKHYKGVYSKQVLKVIKKKWKNSFKFGIKNGFNFFTRKSVSLNMKVLKIYFKVILR